MCIPTVVTSLRALFAHVFPATLVLCDYLSCFSPLAYRMDWMEEWNGMEGLGKGNGGQGNCVFLLSVFLPLVVYYGVYGPWRLAERNLEVVFNTDERIRQTRHGGGTFETLSSSKATSAMNASSISCTLRR